MPTFHKPILDGLLQGDLDGAGHALVDIKSITMPPSTLTYGATTTVDFSSNSDETLALTGNTTFASLNLAAGRKVRIFITADASTRNLTFPGGWIFVGGAAPASLAASAVALLTLTSYAADDAHVVARFEGPGGGFSGAYADLTGKPTLGTAAAAATTDFQAASATLTRLAAVPVALTDAVSVATDASLSTVFDVTLGGNRTLANPTNPADGMRVLWRIKQDVTGTRTLTLDTAFRIPSTSTLTSPLNSATFTTAGKTTNLAAVYNAAASKWDLVAEVEGY